MIVFEYNSRVDEEYVCKKITVHDFANNTKYVHGLDSRHRISQTFPVIGSNAVCCMSAYSRRIELWNIGEKITRSCKVSPNGRIVSVNGKLWNCHCEFPEYGKKDGIIRVSDTTGGAHALNFGFATFKSTRDHDEMCEFVVDIEGSLIVACNGMMHIRKAYCDYFDAKIVRTPAATSSHVSVDRCLYYSNGFDQWVSADYRERTKYHIHGQIALNGSDNLTQMRPLDDRTFAATFINPCVDEWNTAFRLDYYDVRNLSRPVANVTTFTVCNANGKAYDFDLSV